MAELDEILERLETLLVEMEELDEPLRAKVFELLDGIDVVHRTALQQLGDLLGGDELARLRSDPAVAWMLDAYAVGLDEKSAADAALEDIRPYIHSHGGDVEVLAADRGVVHVRMKGACSGCTASAVTLQQGVEEALREKLPGFAALEVEEDDAPPHPPPGPTLLQIEPPQAR